MAIAFGDYAFEFGDRFYIQGDPGVITYEANQGSGEELEVMLSYNGNVAYPMDAQTFANLVDMEFYRPVTSWDPAYQVGETFFHLMNEKMIQIVHVTRYKSDDIGEYKYTISLTDEDGNMSYSIVGETYLSEASVPYSDVKEEPPTIPVDEPLEFTIVI